MNKLKIFFKNLMIFIFRVRYVVVKIKDVNIATSKAPNNLYPGKDAFVTVAVPSSRVIDFRRNAGIRESVIVELNGKDYIIDVASVEYIYDLMNGNLVEIILYSNLTT